MYIQTCIPSIFTHTANQKPLSN